MRVASRITSERTERIVRLDHLTGLENIFSHGLLLDVLYICAKEKNSFAELLQKDLWCCRFIWDLAFAAGTPPTKLLQRSDQTCN